MSVLFGLFLGIVPPVDADRKTSFIMLNSDLKPKKYVASTAKGMLM